MVELPEAATLARQIGETLTGQKVTTADRGNAEHKFFWCNLDNEDLGPTVAGKTVGKTWYSGRFFFVELKPHFVLFSGDIGGKILLTPPDQELPKKRHFSITFHDGSVLTSTIQMWGFIQIVTAGEEKNHPYAGNPGADPLVDTFDQGAFDSLLDGFIEEKDRSIKAFLATGHDHQIAGIGNGYLQDILYVASVHPKRKASSLTKGERSALRASIQTVFSDAVALGGRCTEVDLYGNPGGYTPKMDKNTLGLPCPKCGSTIEKISYMGGTCYICPTCQPL